MKEMEFPVKMFNEVPNLRAEFGFKRCLHYWVASTQAEMKIRDPVSSFWGQKKKKKKRVSEQTENIAAIIGTNDFSRLAN